MATLGRLLEEGRQRLAQLPTGRLEAEVLLAHCLGRQRAFLYANPERDLPAATAAAYAELLRRRLGGEPIAYITGQREFWSLSLGVSPAVLIPRPETELLVEQALSLLPADATCRVADLGTGSGAVALALASERPGCEVHGVDLSPDAIEIARDNARRLGLERVRFHLGSWCQPLTGRFRLIVSNPPYVAGDDPHLAAGDCRFEPRQALTPGPDALAAIRELAAQARDRLEPAGWLMLEHGPGQGAEVRALLTELAYADVGTTRDLLGHERVTRGCWSG